MKGKNNLFESYMSSLKKACRETIADPIWGIGSIKMFGEKGFYYYTYVKFPTSLISLPMASEQ